MLKFFKSPRTIKPLSRKQSIRNLILWGTFALTINSVHAMDSEEKPNAYILETGKEGAERLDLQDQFLETLSRKHLKDAGLSPWQKVGDVGSGSGPMTVHLAKEAALVYAIDKSKKQLDVAREKVKSKGLEEKVEFIEADITSMNTLPIQDVNLFYMRFVLMHISDNDLKRAIYNIHHSLKPGGAVVSQEPIMSSSIYKNLPGYIEALSALAAEKHVDYDIGNRLVSLYQEAGFRCTVERHRPMLTPRQAKGVHLLGLAEWKDEAIEKNIIQQQQVDEWVSIINSWPEEGDITSIYTAPENVYVIATKE